MCQNRHDFSSNLVYMIPRNENVLLASKRPKGITIKPTITNSRFPQRLSQNTRIISPKLPPIVIPFSPSSTESNSQPRVIQYQYQQHNDIVYDKKLYPLTPHPQVSVNINPDLEHLRLQFDYSLISEFETEKQTPEFNAKTDSLNSLITITKNPLLRNSISQFSLSDLFDILVLHIILPLPSLPPENPYAEFSSPYYYRNWTHLEKCHTIFLQLLSLPSFQNFLSFPFLQKLISQLDTPVNEAHKPLENEIITIMNNFHHERLHIIRTLLSK